MSEEKAPESGEANAELAEASSLLADVFVEGEPVMRAASTRLVGRTLKLNDRELSLDSLFWVARRAGLLLLFGRDSTVALQADKEHLEELARSIERLIGRDAQRQLLQPLSREVIVCTAGTAVSGHVDGQTVHGLHLAVFTQRALHLLATDRRHTISWPVEAAERLAPDSQERQALLLWKGETKLRLLYLFPEELRAVERVARQEPRTTAPEPSGEAALEMFARGEVAPPPPVVLPEFAVSADSIRVAAVHGAARVSVDAELEPLDQRFFEDHFRELGEIALGPLLLRKSAAAAAGSMAAGVRAIDAASLREDTRAAAAAAAAQVRQAFNEHLEAVSDARESRLAELRMTETDARDLAETMNASLEELAELHDRLAAGQARLMAQLETLDTGPPDAEESDMEVAAEEWRGALGTLDAAYRRLWRRQVDAIADLWSSDLIPRIETATRPALRRLPEWAQLLLLGVGALLTGALLVILL
jgi:hypothetical protein